MPPVKEDPQVDNVENFSIPQSRYVPKVGDAPSYQPSIPNFADKEETVKKVLSWVKSFKAKFESQGQRSAFDTELDIADEMFRAAANRTTLNSDQSQNVVSTSSKIKSATFYADLRAITASEQTVILGNEEQLPVTYEPIPGSKDYQEDEGRRVSEYRNMILSYVMETGKMRSVFSDELWALNKYANIPVEMTWEYCKEKRKVRQPVKFEVDEEGKRTPTKFKFVDKEFIVADWPKLIIHDNKDVWVDAMVEDMQKQSCIIVRTQKTYNDLVGQQRNGGIMNVDKLKLEHRYQGESQINKTKEDRQDNAGESPDADTPTNLFDTYYGWIQVPINDETGAWEPNKEISHWYEYAFVGPESGDQVCIKLKKLPYSCGKIPFDFHHSHKDDKGVYHMGYSSLVKSNIAQEMTTFDQAFDNVKMRTRKPWICERGSLSIRDKTFAVGGNQIFWKTPGAQDPHEIDTQDTTSICIPMLDQLKEKRREIMGTNKPLLGEALGGRTSASEALGVFEQALKPALEDAKYKANQILVFAAYWVKEMWDQFSDPERSLFVTFEGEQREIKPENVWGDLNIRVTAIANFQDGIIRRKEEDQFMNQTLPVFLAQGVIDQSGLRVLGEQILTNRGFHNVDGILSNTGDADARRIARMENTAILIGNVYDLPKPEENHKVHLEVHKPTLASIVLLPKEQQPLPASMSMFKLHIQQHEQMIAQKAQAAMQGAQQPQGMQEAPPRTPGEVVGDMMGATEGAAENLGAVEDMGGRPPMGEEQRGDVMA